MADLELSLDDIIKKRLIKGSGKPKKFNDNRRKTALPVKRLAERQKSALPKKQGIVDARLKLTRNRLRLGTGSSGPVTDARIRLEALRKRKVGRNRQLPSVVVPEVLRRTVPGGIAMDVEDDYEFSLPGLTSRSRLLRTVQNDMTLYRRPFDWDRPVEDEIEFERMKSLTSGSAVPNRFRSNDPAMKDIRMTIVNQCAGTMRRPNSSICHSEFKGYMTSNVSDRFHNDRNAEAAIKVQALMAQLKAAQGEFQPKSEQGCRIVVSNLVHSVSGEDVQELFADIGELISSKVVRPGVAEVVYRHYEDAVKAVDVYHNRQLDGQPMKCLLVKNNESIPKKPKSVELDLVTLRNALHVKKPTSS